MWGRELNLVLWDNLEGWGGVRDGSRVQEGGGIRIPAADSCWRMAEANTILWSNYPPIKDFWTLWEKMRVGCFKRTSSKHVYYLGWNRSPAQVGCMRQVFGPGALGRPRGIGWRGRWEGGSGWGIHVNPWPIHVNVWQKPLQYCKVISLQLIKINEKNKIKSQLTYQRGHHVLFKYDVNTPIVSCHLWWCFIRGPFLGTNNGVGCHFLLQGIFLTQRSSLRSSTLLADSLPTKLKGNPKTIPFSRGSSPQPRDWTLASCIAGRFFTVWATREARLGIPSLNTKPIQKVSFYFLSVNFSFNLCIFLLFIPITAPSDLLVSKIDINVAFV